MASGIENPGVVDLVLEDPKDGTITLVIVGPEAWLGSDAEQDLLVRKIEGYLAYVQSGELCETFPEAEGRPIRFQLNNHTPVPDGMKPAIRRVTSYLAAEYAIELVMRDLWRDDPGAE